MNNGLQICTIAAEMARKTKAVCQKKETTEAALILDVLHIRTSNWMAVPCADVNIVAPKIRPKAL